ncbi:MIP/aquaporin family protein [Baekduia sp. Peel2402]|uniref:MIP/aquaporin family protein n=1 Tax=Baekduia sp. Peel2402 TaxID=3458296 RepID=UPI00403EA0D4
MPESTYPPDKGYPAYLAEFVGTAILVVAICAFISRSAPVPVDLLSIGLVHAIALMAIVYTIGSISGAHVNPAVTLALLMIRKISPRDAGGYLGSQFAGALVGALLARMFFSTRGSVFDFGAATVNPLYLHGGSVWLALIAEALGTFILMWAVMGTAVNPDAPNGVAGVAIGGSLGLAVLLFGPATGGSFNPARWFGPALVSGTWSDGWLYLIGPVLGAIAAAATYLFVMEHSRRQVLPAQAPEVGESATPPGGAVPLA